MLTSVANYLAAGDAAGVEAAIVGPLSGAEDEKSQHADRSDPARARRQRNGTIATIGVVGVSDEGAPGVAERLAAPAIDYVRLDISARRAG